MRGDPWDMRGSPQKIDAEGFFLLCRTPQEDVPPLREPDFLNGIPNGACSSGGSGFVCGQDLDSVSLAPAEDYLTWEWKCGVAGFSLFPDLAGAHVEAKYTNEFGTLNGAIFSEGASVPETATLLLFGSGLVGLAGIAWKRNRRE